MKRILFSFLWLLAASAAWGQAAATPAFSVAGGSYATPQFVALSDATSGALIYYTTDGSVPTTASAVYQYPLWVYSTQTVKAIAAASGYSTSLTGTSSYVITPPGVNFSLMRGGNTQVPVPFPLYDRMQPVTGVELRQISTARGSYSWTNYDNWVSSTVAHGGNVVFTLQARPNWMTGLNDSTTDGPPSDLNTSAACQGVLTGTTTTDCTQKEWATAWMMHVTGLSAQPSSPVSCPKLNFVEGGNEVDTYSGTFSIVGWSGSPQQFVQQSNDVAAIVHKWCSVTTTRMLLGSVSSIWGANAVGHPQYDVYMGLLLGYVGAANAYLYQGVSFHNYGARTTTTPAPPPTSVVSYSASSCTAANTPNSSCYVSVAQQIPRLQSVALNQSSTLSWSGHLPILITEGGFGEVNQLNGDNTFGIAYVSELIPLVAATGATNTISDMLYLGEDASSVAWGCYWKCGTSGTISPWYQALTQTTAWLAAATSIGAYTTSSITGGTMWRVPLNGGASEIDWCAVQNPATCSTTTAFTTQQDINGVISSTGGNLTLSSTAMLVYTPASGAAATPAFSPAAGIYASPQTVSLSDSTSGATIYYTLDGSTPTTASAVYAIALTVSATKTIKAIATAPGHTQSAVGSATYTIVAPPPTLLKSAILNTSAVN